MARKLPGPLVGGLIDVADHLAHATGSASFRQAAMRRAVSSAYYAVFHALCAVCSDALIGWRKTRQHPAIYRSLDHGAVERRLRSGDAQRIESSIRQLALLFSGLQQERHAADYADSSALFSRTQTLVLIEDARDAIALIENLDTKARLELAVLLIARQRTA